MTDGRPVRSSLAGMLGAVWGILGLSFILGRGLYCLYPYVRELHDFDMQWFHWFALGASIVFMGYAEGYKGFQLKFSPRAAARARYLKQNPTLMRILFAPFFCMGLFHATRKRKIASWSLTIGIVVLIIIVRSLPQPWRGIIDAGVLLGLGWGVLSIWVFSGKVMAGRLRGVSPETPD